MGQRQRLQTKPRPPAPWERSLHPPFSWPNTSTPSLLLEGDRVSCASGPCWELRAWLHSDLHFRSMTLSILGTSKRIKSPPQKAQGGHKGHDGGRGSSLCFKNRVTCNQKSAGLFPLASSLVPTPREGRSEAAGPGAVRIAHRASSPSPGPHPTVASWRI